VSKTDVPTVVTSCTNRKRHAPAAELCGRNLPRLEATPLAQAWRDRFERASGGVVPVSELYCGRGFREAERGARVLGARLWVVSAGLGLVPADFEAPSYSLTLSPGAPDAVQRVLMGPVSAWWEAIQGKPFEDAGGLILVALPSPYLKLVAQAWSRWPAERLARVRLFTKDLPGGLPRALAAQWMPYDDRLDRLGDGLAGTQGDFAQRAMRHFAETFAGAAADVAADAARVREALAPVATPPRAERERLSDEELVALIRREWDVVAGRSGAMLARLRRELNVACEQGRFKDLFGRAAAERQGALL